MIVGNIQEKTWLAQINQDRQLLEMDFKIKIHQHLIKMVTFMLLNNNKSNYFMITINQKSKTSKTIIIILVNINKALHKMKMIRANNWMNSQKKVNTRINKKKQVLMMTNQSKAVHPKGSCSKEGKVLKNIGSIFIITIS